MLSPVHLSPLNSSTPAVLSSLCSSSSSSFPSSTQSSSSTTPCVPSSSSPLGNTVKQERKITSPSLSLSRLKSVFVFAICVALVSAASAVSTKPSPASSSTMTSDAGNGSLPEGNDTSTLPSDLPQMDEPPRNIPASKPLPSAWQEQSQGRLYYLRANNDQYIQIYGKQITGTLEARPAYGILKFSSHNLHVVIASYHTGEYLCMNESGVLYLKEKPDPECYISEENLHRNGSLNNVYVFVEYSTEDQKRYLAIDCDPIVATNTQPNLKSMRFVNDKVTAEQASDIKRQIEEGKEDKLAKKCEQKSSKPSPEKREKKRLRKLRARWCWNLNRMTNKRKYYYARCTKKYCSKKETCVCDILKKMMVKTKRAKRNCLKQKLSRWVKKRKQTPKETAITEAAKLLLPNYSKIARRIRNIKRKMKQQQSQPKQTLQTQQNTQQQIEDTEQQILKLQNTKGRGRPQIVKLNPILKTFGDELFENRDIQTAKETNMTTENPLSKTFVEALKKLSPHKIRHRKKHRNRRRGKKRRGRRGRKVSDKTATSSTPNDKTRDTQKQYSSSPS